SGSAGLDVTTVTETVLLDQKVAKIPLNVTGLLGGNLSALLVGRSSTTLQGLFILPGVIDANYNGQIHALAWTPSPPVTIPAGSRMAQLVPFKACVSRASNTVQGASGFGSTGLPELYWTLQITSEHPTIKVTLVQTQAKMSQVTLSALVDTRADVTVIS
ncbi:POK9 protein, partial [Psophia crepitans]|nr:POK9 protein [Psophia crepitans]